jgi:hypothetical protein
MPVISPELLRAHRQSTFHLHPPNRLKTKEDAVAFVNQRGFVHFWPYKGLLLPSLWAAVAGDRPVPNEHDDPGHITWGWKDELLGSGRWFYARVLCRRNTIISIDILPYFYALSPNYGDPENDYLEEYRQGLLTQEAKVVYETVLHQGPLDTLELRRLSHLANPSSKYRFSRALDDLQMRFMLMPIGISPAGRWRYAFIYDLVTRHFPTLVERSHPITEHNARYKLVMQYLLSLGAARERDVNRLFGWGPEVTQRTINNLIRDGTIMGNCSLQGTIDNWLAIPQLISS